MKCILHVLICKWVETFTRTLSITWKPGKRRCMLYLERTYSFLKLQYFDFFYWKQQNEISQRDDNWCQKVWLQILFDCCKDSWCLPYWNGVNLERAPNNSIAPQLAFVRYKLYGFLAVVYQLLCAIAMYFVIRRCNGESFRAFPPF